MTGTTTAPPTADAPWPVAVLARELRAYIDRLGTAWVEGEITQWNTSAGNVYGKLKDVDAEATVSFTIWSSVRAKIDGDFAQGDRVIALVKPNYWVKGGTLTMQVFEVRHVGLGDLLERLERLRRTLAAEGLFAPERKRRLPFLPQCIGLITARDSDAEKDVRHNALLRWPAVRFKADYAAVQGERTVAEVTAALTRLDVDPEVDVIVIARGGGDFQNLLGFSDERLVRAVAACTTPVVSAIGHDADHPILDDVADLRASTPTDAAKRVVPDVTEESTRLRQARSRMTSRLANLITTEIQRLAQLRTRPALADPSWIVEVRAQDLTRYVARGAELAERSLESATRTLGEHTARLRALSPRATLDRGYAIVQRGGGAIVRDAADASAGTPLTVTLRDGAIDAVSSGRHRDSTTAGHTDPEQ